MPRKKQKKKNVKDKIRIFKTIEAAKKWYKPLPRGKYAFKVNGKKVTIEKCL